MKFWKKKEDKKADKPNVSYGYICNPYNGPYGELLAGIDILIYEGETYCRIDPMEFFRLRLCEEQYISCERKIADTHQDALENKADAMRAIKKIDVIKEKYQTHLKINKKLNIKNRELNIKNKAQADIIQRHEKIHQQHQIDMLEYGFGKKCREVPPEEDFIGIEYLKNKIRLIEEEVKELRIENERLRRIIWDCNEYIRKVHGDLCYEIRTAPKKRYINEADRMAVEKAFLRKFISILSIDRV